MAMNPLVIRIQPKERSLASLKWALDALAPRYGGYAYSLHLNWVWVHLPGTANAQEERTFLEGHGTVLYYEITRMR